MLNALITRIEWGVWRGEPWFVILANICGINIPTVAKFMLSLWWQPSCNIPEHLPVGCCELVWADSQHTTMASVTSLSSPRKPSVILPCTKAQIQILQQDWGGLGRWWEPLRFWIYFEGRANKICWWIEFGVESSMTPGFLGWTTGTMQLSFTKMGRNGFGGETRLVLDMWRSKWPSVVMSRW